MLHFSEKYDELKMLPTKAALRRCLHRRWSKVLLKAPILPGSVRFLQETGFAACLFLFVLNFGHLTQKLLTIFTKNATLKME